jgi:ABC-type phosphate transport system substrate-binding protein
VLRLALATAGSAWLDRAWAAGDGLQIIVHPNNRITKLTMDELRDIFRGEQRHFDGGEEIAVMMRQTGAPEKEFLLRKVLNMTDVEFKKEWLGRIYRGDATSPPLVLDSEATMRRHVSRVAGAIGYLAKGATLEGVKSVLTID